MKEFMKRDDFPRKPENAEEQCRGPMPNVPMMPRSDGMYGPRGRDARQNDPYTRISRQARRVSWQVRRISGSAGI